MSRLEPYQRDCRCDCSSVQVLLFVEICQDARRSKSTQERQASILVNVGCWPLLKEESVSGNRLKPEEAEEEREGEKVTNTVLAFPGSGGTWRSRPGGPHFELRTVRLPNHCGSSLEFLRPGTITSNHFVKAANAWHCQLPLCSHREVPSPPSPTRHEPLLLSQCLALAAARRSTDLDTLGPPSPFMLGDDNITATFDLRLADPIIDKTITITRLHSTATCTTPPSS